MENRPSTLAWLSIASELGFIIALPIVLFALGGRWLDRRFDTGAVFLVSGVVLAAVLSAITIGRRLKTLVKRLGP